MNLDEMLALLPDNNSGEIDAADLRAIVTQLFNDTADTNTLIGNIMADILPALTDLTNRVQTLEPEVAQLTRDVNDLTGRVEILETKADIHIESGSWQFNSGPLPPTGSQVRLDSTDQHAASVAVFRLIDNDGADRPPLFNAGIVGLRIQDFDNADAFNTYDVFPPVTIDSDGARLALMWKNGGDTVPDQKALCIFAVDLSS